MPIREKDARYIWHPFRQEQTGLPIIPIVKAKGSYLFDEDGRKYLDLVSSWWVITHGHCHPKIAQAIANQAHTLEQVLFADMTHPLAADLAEQLVLSLPGTLSRVFFSDNGSSAVEIALKLSYQYWYNQGAPERRRFMCFDGGYHGDTFGAMAAGKSSGFYKPFESFLFHVDVMPYPATWDGDEDVEAKENKALKQIESHLNRHAKETAAFIMEPLIQGASGMRMCRPEFIQQVVDLIKSSGTLVIFDEVMTGFGRTGSLFATQKIGLEPDIICLSKGLTGGFMPLAVTVVTQKIYESFLGETFEKAFAHGHSFAANPIGCAAALASLALFEEEQTIAKVKTLEETHRQETKKLAKKSKILKARIIGSIMAFEIDDTFSYNSQQLKKAFIERGLFLRPLENVVYILPPYCTSAEQLEWAYAEITKVLED